MDAERRCVFALARLAAGERLPPKPLARLQRADDPLRARDRFGAVSDPGESLVCVGAYVAGLWAVQISRGCFSAFHSPVLARVGRFSKPPRKASAKRRLL